MISNLKMLADLLREHPEYSTLDETDLEKLIEMTKKERILKKLGYTIWKNQNDDRWYAHYNVDGKRKLASRKEKQKLIDFLISANNIFLDPSFKDLYKHWIEVQGELVSNNCKYRYETDRKRYFSCPEMEHPLSLLTESKWKAFFIKTIKELKLNNKATKTLVNTCKRVMNQAVVDKIIQENPLEFVFPKDFYKITTNIKRPREKEIATKEQVEMLKNILIKSLEEKPEYSLPAAVLLSIHTGMRVGEIAALRWDHIITNEAFPYILIDRMEIYNQITKERYVVDHTKNMDVREFPITGQIRDILKFAENAQNIAEIESEWIFTNTAGNRASASSISCCIKNKCEQAKRRGKDIPVMSIHQLRRTFNSNIRMFTTATVAAALLGNSEEVNTAYYTIDVTSMKEKYDLVKKIT